MSNQITGKILHISETESVGANATPKRMVVVESNEGQYPDSVVIEAFKDKATMLDKFSVGQTVTAHFNLKAREWEGRWYTNVGLWKIESGTTAPAHEEDPLGF